jgi:hypothetical protein
VYSNLLNPRNQALSTCICLYFNRCVHTVKPMVNPSMHVHMGMVSDAVSFIQPGLPAVCFANRNTFILPLYICSLIPHGYMSSVSPPRDHC